MGSLEFRLIRFARPLHVGGSRSRGDEPEVADAIASGSELHLDAVFDLRPPAVAVGSRGCDGIPAIPATNARVLRVESLVESTRLGREIDRHDVALRLQNLHELAGLALQLVCVVDELDPAPR